MGFFTKKTVKPTNAVPGPSAFVGSSADGSQAYNGSAHNAAVHRSQELQRTAQKEAARRACVDQAIAADRIESERPQQFGQKSSVSPAETSNLIEFPRHSSPMFLGEKTGVAADDRYKFVSLGLSADRFIQTLIGIDATETEWARGYNLPKKEKKRINWPIDTDIAVARFLEVENKKLASEGVFVRFAYKNDPAIDEYSILAMFPENQSQYNAWKQDMFR